MGFLAFLGPVIELVGGWLNHKMEITKIEREGEIELTKATIIGAQRAAELGQQWDLEAIKNSGWKDEYLTVVLSIPLIGCFIPGLDRHILRGFAILTETPVWYQVSIGAMIAAAFGMKQFANYMQTKNGG